MEVKYRGKYYRFDKRMTVKRILEELNINPETVMVARNGELVTKDETINPEDSIKIVPVISGG
ncbi:MAG: MoaD/ThiS family protein [Spirochaetota bacterium]